MSGNIVMLGCDLIGGGACPEQYDVFLGEDRIGYMRLRHGMFEARHRDWTGDQVFFGWPRGDGSFEDDEREKWLTLALRALLFRHRGGDEVETRERAELARLKQKYERDGQ